MINTIILSMPGGMEWILIIAVIVLLFGGRKIPELMKGIGEGIREFKKSSKVPEEKEQPATPSTEKK